MFLNTLPSKAQVTTLAAIQLVMMQASTSLMFSRAFIVPGIAPQSAPASTPARKARIHTRKTPIFSVGRLRATMSEAIVPIRYCPGAPMLNRPVLKATATERPVMIRGMARKSVLPMLVGLKPQVSEPVALRPVENRPKKISRTPSQAPLREMRELNRPTITTTTAPTSRPMRMETSEASSFLVPSFW